MKHIFSILLALILLCSCTVSTDSNPNSDMPVPTDAEDRFMENSPTDGIIQEDSEQESSVIREYHETVMGDPSDVHLSTQLVGNRIAYIKKEFEDAHHEIAIVTFFDEYGNQIEEYSLPTPEDIRSAKEIMMLDSVFLLSDGRWFTVYYADGNTDFYHMYLLAADGTVLHNGLLNGSAGAYYRNNRECIEMADGAFRLFLINGSDMRWYDETLTEQGRTTVKDAPFGVNNLYHIGGSRYYYNDGFTLSRGIIDLETGACSPADVSLSGDNYGEKLVYGANGADYIISSLGIDRHDADGTRTEVFSWSEVGIDSSTLDFSEILAVNDNAFVVPQLKKENGRGINSQVIYGTSLRAASGDVQTITIKGSLTDAAWLNQAIYAFNRQNPHYRVKYKQVKDKTYAELVSDTLLFDKTADMLMLPIDGFYSAHYDKGAFVDLAPTVQHLLLPSVYRAKAEDGGALYTFPTTMAFSALAAKKGTVSGALTWDALYALCDGLSADEYLIAPQYTGGMDVYENKNGQLVPLGYQMNDLASALYTNTLSDFVHTEAADSSFDSSQFREAVQFLQWLDTHMDVNVGGTQMSNGGNDRISTGIFPMRLRAGNIRLAEVMVSDIRHFTVLDMLFGEEDYTLFGYPGTDEDRLMLNTSVSNFFPAVLADTDVMEGCLAFVEFLLSDAMQITDSLPALPVTMSAMEHLLDQNTYQYYSKTRYEQLERGSDSEYLFSEIGTTAEYREDYGLLRDTEELYTVFSFTDEKKEEIMAFFEDAKLCTSVDRTVKSIVNEELSAWQGGVRTLEETTKIIDSRVWIYLNE